MALSNGGFSKFHGKEEALGLGLARIKRGLGRKRVLISKSNQENVSNSNQNLRKRSKSETTKSSNSVLESLHQDILIRVLCHVDHGDLERLKRVSKTIRNAVLEAKKSHFDYTTPKKTLSFRDPLVILDQDSNSNGLSDQDEPPNAPTRRKNVIRESDLSKISMVLFK